MKTSISRFLFSGLAYVSAVAAQTLPLSGDAWSESGVNGTNAPVPAGYIASAFPVATPEAYYSVDATTA